MLVLGFAFSRQQQSYALIVACILSYIFFFGGSFGTCVWVYIFAELFPNAVRARAASLATMVLWIACLLVTLTFLSLVHAAGVAGAFWIYSSICAVTFVYILLLLPETKGKSLEEIQESWHLRSERVETTPR